MDRIEYAEVNADANISPGHSNHATDNASQSGRRCSIMRGFLESGEDFTWPREVGETVGGRCVFNPRIRQSGEIPLKFKRRISDKKASIEEYEAHSKYPYDFKHSFIVKTIRADRPEKSRQEAAREVDTMKDLRHPHIAALLGSFEHRALLSILIFPVACCDLHRLMKSMSKNIQLQNSSKDTLQRCRSRSNSTTSSEESPVSSSNPSASDGMKLDSGGKGRRDKPEARWPVCNSLQGQRRLLRHFFVCLCQALSYLHTSDVRHKDIKPENILIDETGSVILTDFGISRRFPKNTSHVTSNERKYTRKYASPEMMEGPKTPRDDPSDVFSLGCVFLEMETLLLDYDLSILLDRCSSRGSDNAKEDAYYCNLEGTYRWIQEMQDRPQLRISSAESQQESVKSSAPTFDPAKTIVDSLVHVRSMLDSDPVRRPKSDRLWEKFQHISPEKCQDCDPRLPSEIWRPSKKQQKEAETGRQKRRSVLPTEKLLSPQPSWRGPVMESVSEPLRRLQSDSENRERPQSSSEHIRLLQQPLLPLNVPGVFTAVPTSRADAAVKEQENINGLSRPTSSDADEVKQQLVLQTTLNTSTENAQADMAKEKRARSRSPSRKLPSDHTQVINYDFSRKEAYQTDFGLIKDLNPKDYELPRLGQQIDLLLDKEAALIVTVDLGVLGWSIRIKRMLGFYDRIYVTKYDR